MPSAVVRLLVFADAVLEVWESAFVVLAEDRGVALVEAEGCDSWPPVLSVLAVGIVVLGVVLTDGLSLEDAEVVTSAAESVLSPAYAGEMPTVRARPIDRTKAVKASSISFEDADLRGAAVPIRTPSFPKRLLSSSNVPSQAYGVNGRN